VALGGGKFEPRAVTLGPQAEHDMFQVHNGLKEGERIVISGQFLLDSESQLRESILKMQGPGESVGASERQSREVTPTRNATNAPSTLTVKYICPMPEHVAIEYDHPGKCPICGMTLVPVSSAALAKIQPGGKVIDYTCPMPEHSDVHESKPGKCPKCGMTLIPIMEQPKPAPQPPALNSQPAKLYTCPMASDADVVSDKPGKCSKCQMDLVPTSTVAHGKIAEENWRKKHAAER
jgi:hypothetical protein